MIAIDEPSIANIGRWPWPREVQAKLIEQLAAAKAKVIGNTVFFFEPQKDPGLVYVEKMLEDLQQGLAGRRDPGRPRRRAPSAAARRPRRPRTAPATSAEIGKILREASVSLNGDVRMAL